MKKIMIEGMSCNHCVAHVKEALEALEGAKNVQVDLAQKCATVEGNLSEEAIKEAIDDAGYDVISVTEV